MTDCRSAAFAAAIPSAVLGAALLCVPFAARGDAVADWNATAIAVTANPPNSMLQSRVMSIVQGAVFDAANSVERRYPAMQADVIAAPGASQEAAIASAAHHILSRLAPTQQAALDAALSASLACGPKIVFA